MIMGLPGISSMIKSPRTAQPILIKLMIDDAFGLSVTLKVAKTAAFE